MKSKQSQSVGLCKALIVLLSVLHLTSAYPFSKEESARCRSLLAEQLDPKILPKSLVGRNTFLLKDRPSYSSADVLSRLLEVTERGRTCKGVVDKLLPGADFRVIFSIELDLKAPPNLLVVTPTYKPASPTLLTVTCDDDTQCLNITFIERGTQSQRLHRRAASHMTSEGGSRDSEKGVSFVGGLLVTVIGLVVLVVVVALCAGGSNTYDTNTTAAFKTSEDPAAAVVVTTEVVVPAEQQPSQAEPNGQKQNGSVAPEQPTTSSEPADKRNSLSPPAVEQQPSKPEERAERARTLSARSFDPLPEIPKLELAEDIEKDDKGEDGEDPYSYARVPKAEEVPQSDSSDGEDVDSPKRGPSSPTGAVPPYGKVTSSDATKRASLNDGEYAEVAGEGKRDRAITAPVDPAELTAVRSNRAFTESATHLPLPAIPKGLRPTDEEENEMYDSIPEDLSGKEAKPAKIRKDRLYESVDEMADENEDMYESVPEELKPDSPISPVVVSPVSPEPPPLPVTTPPKPPDSPLPTHRSSIPEVKLEEPQGKGKKKQLEKTTSASADQNKEKRAFSLFSRKKATSVSAGVGKTRKNKAEKEREKDTQSPQQLKPHQGEPLPDIPPLSSPSQPLPSPGLPFPSTAVPGDEDEDMYDRPQLPEPALGKSRLSSESDIPHSRMPTTEEAKARARTLPAGMRSAGLSGFKSRQDVPLPEVPEDSGQGMITVTHTRRLEDGSAITKPYDIIHISTPPPDDEEEPNYDTVRPEVFQSDPSSEVRNDADPGYDKVGIKLEPMDDGEGDALKSDEDKQSERSTSPTGDVRVTAVAGASSPDQTLQVAAPDHDETGYARVPEMYLMRKRAMSASQGVKQKTKSPEHAKVSADDSDLTQSSTNPEEMYAIIDKAAKKKSREQKQEQEMLSPIERSSGGASPVPPPIPPFIDVGDLSEFSEPPLPERSDDANHLVVNVENDSGYSRVLKAGESSDPPYAKVKSKVEHPYAELDIGGAKPDLVSGEQSPDALKPLVNDLSSGYDTVGDVESKASPTEALPDEDSHMYDTLGPPEPTKDKATHGISPEDLATNTYDSLEEEPQQNTYDTLEPSEEQNGEMDDKEGPYEEINESTRQNLRILHKNSLT